jgi:hypothetical protein
MGWVACPAGSRRRVPAGTTTRPGARALGPIGPDTLAKPMVQGDVRPLEAVCHRAMRALGQAGVLGQQVTGMADGTDGATTARDAGCGRATRTRRIEDTRGQGHESAVTVYGWQVLRWIEAAPKMPLAVQGGQIQAREPPWTRALVTQARAHGAGAANPLNAVVVRPWHGRDDGPGGNTVFLTHAAVDTPWPPCDDDEERRLSDNCGMQAAKQPWDLGQPPPKTARAVRVPVLFTLPLVAWATASRWPCAREAVGGEPVG